MKDLETDLLLERRVLPATIGGRVGFAILAIVVLAVPSALAAAAGLAAYLGGEQAWQSLYDAGSPRLVPDVLEIVQAVPDEAFYLPVALAQWPVLTASYVGALVVLLWGRFSSAELLLTAAVAVFLFLRECSALQATAEAEHLWTPVLPLWSVPVGGSVLLAAPLFVGGWLFRVLVSRWGEMET